MGLLDLCKKYYNSENLYEVLGISEKATDKEVKKAYHKVSLKVHPDHVNEEQKLEATEKFKVLGSVHATLSDKDKRAVYNATKSVDDDDFNIIKDRDWTIYWRSLFKKVTFEDVNVYEKEYIGSENELKDLRHAYLIGKGDMDYIAKHVPFARSKHEPRYREIVNEMISKGEVPSYKIFTHEPAKKRLRRRDMEKELGLKAQESKSVELMIQKQQQNRAPQMDNLPAKYGSTGGGGDIKKSKASMRKAAPITPTRTSKRRK